MHKFANVQLGKNGITENFMGTLKSHFKNHENVKISVLKSGTRDKQELKKMSDELLDKLGKNYTARVIGFTIVIKKWRKEVRK
ncbi:YhbY family RNA-binding protein [Candidatus Pacearchaeota archaeon]|nr:YhbY family RNA-binding protein [Candidatus Pacearchaeota archaeon]